jgi:hypothetical protein
VFAVGLFPSIGSDDSYLTYWAAHTLSSSGEIVNYNGARIEQSSSFLHVVILALLALISPLSLPVIGSLLGLVCGALTVFVTGRLARVLDQPVSFLAALLMALSTPLLYWSMGGLETTLASFVFAWLLLSVANQLSKSRSDERSGGLIVAVPVVSYLLVRPEGVAVIGSTLIGVLIVFMVRMRLLGDPDGQGHVLVRRTMHILSVALMASAAIATLRLTYFGSPVPQPVSAKTGGASLTAGLSYLQLEAFTKYDTAMWLLAIVGILMALFRAARARSSSPMALLLGMSAVAQAAFVLLCGGDWMPRGRFLVPMLPLVVVSSLLFIRNFRAPVAWPAAAVLMTLQAWPVANVVRFSSPPPLWSLLETERRYEAFSWLEHLNGEHHRDMPAILALRTVVDQLREGNRQPVSILTGQMGMIPYYLTLSHRGQVRYLDRFGLATRDFTDCPVTAGLPRDALGLRLEYAWFFEHRVALRAACGLGDPEVLVDLARAIDPLGADRRTSLAANDYSLVYDDGSRVIAVRGDIGRFLLPNGRRGGAVRPDD